jgi:DNA-binding GntR family transcriptional regulator
MPPTPQLSELPPATLKTHVVERIRNAILTAVFKPGERLNETHLAQQFGVSRIPVREALLQLQEQGLVMNHPRRGMFVVMLSEEDVQRINSLRIVLEAEAIKLCRTNLTPSFEKRLESLVEKMESTNTESDFDASKLDLEFHRTVWSATGNPYLEKTLNSLVTVLFSHQALAYMTAHSSLHWPLRHHRDLLDVILGKSNMSPEAAIMKHLRHRYTNPERYSSLAHTQAFLP